MGRRMPSRRGRRPRTGNGRTYARSLRIEPLEDRRLLAALVGVDFDAVDNRPANWNLGDWAFAPSDTLNVSNLIDETGVLTPLTLSVVSSSFAGVATDTLAGDVPIDASTVPTHSPTLALLRGFLYVDGAGESLTATWKNLAPGATYELYVFGLEGVSGFTDQQSVSINNGAVQFSQSPSADGTDSPLWVNGQSGTTAALESFAVTAVADPSGEIEIAVTATQGSVALGGLAIKEVGFIVNSPDDTDDMNATNGVTTLREAIRLANAHPGADTIVFDNSLSGDTITLGGDELWISGSLVIDASSCSNAIIIDAAGLSRIFYINDNNVNNQIDVTLSNLALTGGKTADHNIVSSAEGGGAVFSTENLTINNSVLSGNRTGTGGHGNANFNANGGNGGRGGAIYSAGNLSISGSTITGNTTGRGGNADPLGGSTYGGYGGGGGAIYNKGTLTISQSTITNNATGGGGNGDTGGTAGKGGGIFSDSGDVTLVDSNLSGNRTGADGFGDSLASAAYGGGIFAQEGTVTLTRSTLSGNSTSGNRAGGGGIFMANGMVTLNNSTLSGNRTEVGAANGGGIYLNFGKVTLTGSTISGNRAAGSGGRGGGISLSGAAELSIYQSTLTDNSASTGGGIDTGFYSNPKTVRLSGSIVSGNANSDVLQGTNTTIVSLGHNLIGESNAIGIFQADATNVIDSNPRIGPLADNGGPTLPNGAAILTHALLPGSPALDAGDPNFDLNVFSPPLANDQRGTGFVRVANAGSDYRIDVGAYESQGVPSFPDGDYNHDGIANAADYTVWRNTLGQMETGLAANGDNSGASENKIDAADYQFWKLHFGNTVVPVAAVAITPLVLPFAGPLAIDGIANSTEPVGSNGPGGVDTFGPSLLVTSSFAVQNGRPASRGLPDNGFFPATALHPDVQLPYRNNDNGNNLIRLYNQDNVVAIDVPNGAYTSLDLAVLSGQGSSPLRVDLNYADGGVALNSTVPDWFDDPAALTSPGKFVEGDGIFYYLRDGLDRVVGATYENSADPALLGLKFAIDPTRTLQSITVTKLNFSSVLSLLGGALSGAAVGLEGASSAGAGAAAIQQPLQLKTLERSTSVDAVISQWFEPMAASRPFPSGRVAEESATATRATDNLLLLAIDRALEVHHDRPEKRWREKACDVVDGDAIESTMADDPLAVAIANWR